MRRQLMTMLAAGVTAATLVCCATERRHVDIFMVGDSTMANKPLAKGNQERGWGQTLPLCFDSTVTIHNHAVNGRSTKSFIDQGRWAEVLDSLKPGDYVIIQFGHNDEKADTARHTEPWGDYLGNLRRFASEAKAKGATPIICNSIVRRNFATVADAVAQDDKSGQAEMLEAEGDSLIETHGEYLPAARKAAEEEGAVFIDMNSLTHELVQSYGPTRSRKLYLWAEPGTVEAYPDGKKDNTHLNVTGATIVAKMAAKAMSEQLPELKERMVSAE